MDVTGQRRTKCPIYNGKPCSIHCSCFNCENRYGIRVTHRTDDSNSQRKKRITSTPTSLKRRRTAAILEEEGSDLHPGPWTLEESCLLDSVESFILNMCVIPSYRNSWWYHLQEKYTKNWAVLSSTIIFRKKLQSQSKWLGHSGVSLSPQCWCTRFGDRTAINNFERDEVSTRREKTAFG